MTMEVSPQPNAQRHRGSELGTAPALQQSWPGAETLRSLSFVDEGPRWAPLTRAGPSKSWGVALSPPSGAEPGPGELLALPCLRLQTQTRSCGAPEPQTLA